MQKVVPLIQELSTYPVTRFSLDYLKRAEEFSQDCHNELGAVPLLFSRAVDPEIFMRTSKNYPFFPTLFFIGENEKAAFEDSSMRKIMERHDFSTGTYCNYFPDDSLRELLSRASKLRPPKQSESHTYTEYTQRLKNFNASLNQFTSFLADKGLNSFTSAFQEKLHKALSPNISDLDSLILDSRAASLYSFVNQHKQRRSIGEFFSLKDSISPEDIDSVASFDYAPFLSGLRERFANSQKIGY